jgi:hypothetical protein
MIDNLTFNLYQNLAVTLLLGLFLFLMSNFFSKRYKLHHNVQINFVIIINLLIILIGVLFSILAFFDFNYLGFQKNSFILLIFLVLLLAYNNNVKILFKEFKKHTSNIVFIFLFFYLILAISPPTDADSLDYHLGMPLQLLIDGKLIVQENWYHQMLFGYGEFINFFGLLFGSKNFGQIINFFAIVNISICLTYFQKKYRSSLNGFFFILATPLMVMLIYSSKTQLLPSSIFLLSIILIIENHKNKNINNALILIFLLFNIGCKFNYVISSFSLGILLLYFNVTKKNLIRIIITGLLAFVFILAPILMLKFSLYGDFFPPLFESFKKNPNNSIVEFYNTLKGDDATFYNFEPYSLYFIFLPFISSLTKTFSNITGLLPISFIGYYYFIYLLFKFKLKNHRTYKIIFILTLLINGFFIFMPNFQPRYWIDLFLIFIIGLMYLCKNNNFFKIMNFVNISQLYCVLIFLIASSVYFFSASFNDARYQKIMKKHAFGYNQSKWINEYVPNNQAVISENLRSRIFMNDNIISREKIFKFNNDKKFNLLYQSKIKFVVLQHPITDKQLIKFFNKCANQDTIKKKEFFDETRNILSEIRKIKYNLILFENKCIE